MMRSLVSTLRVAALVLAASHLAGCQSADHAGMIPSSAYIGLSPEAADAIAGDMVGRLAERVGPGSATIRIEPDGSAFGKAIEASLRAWGYAVATDQEIEHANLVPLAYVVDTFETSVMARLSTRTLNLTRLYSVTATGATATSPLSVMAVGEGS